MTARALKNLLAFVPDYTEIVIHDDRAGEEHFRLVFNTDYGAVSQDDPIIKDLPELEGKLVFIII